MEGQQYHTPFVSVVFGVIGGTSTYVAEHGFIIENFIQFIKVILFGIVGGVGGYYGKILAQRIHRFFKN